MGWAVSVTAVTAVVWIMVVVDMFGRKSRRVQSSASVQDGTLSAVGREMCYRGTLSGCGEVDVWGEVTGDILLTEGHVRVRSGGTVTGRITATTITIEGWVKGRCEGASVQIQETGHLLGSCSAVTFVIAQGGCFSGLSEMPDAGMSGTGPDGDEDGGHSYALLER